jgi:hypothetical protein
MYPAYEYDAISDSGAIKHADLPDVMFRGDLQFNKINPVFLDELRYGIYLDPTSPNEENEGYIYWNTDGGNFGPIWSAFAEGGQDCLVDDLGGFQRDNFEDTYTVTYLEGDLSVTGTVTRVGLCLWTGSVEIDVGTVRALNLSYNDTIARGPQNQYKWTLDNFFTLRTKESPQSSPVGNYVFTGSQTWIVS